MAEVCDAVPLNCYVCYPLQIAYATVMNIEAGLTPGLSLYLWITDKFEKQFKVQVTVEDDGSFNINTADFPEGMFNESAGAFDMFLTTNSDGTGYVDMTFSAHAYQCVILSIICE